jgi:regulator of G-protein signaling
LLFQVLLTPFYCQMEQLLERMQDEQYGVPVRTVKSFMSKIPSVFTGE